MEDEHLYEQAKECVIESGRASISRIQRHLKIGYNRAARLMEQLEKDGVVSEMGPSGVRTIL